MLSKAEVIDKLLRRYPLYSAKKICEILGLNPSKYSQYIWNRKHALKQKGLLTSEEQGRVHVALPHRLRFFAQLNPIIYQRLLPRARRLRKDEPRPSNLWYYVDNRNRQLSFRSDHAKITLFPAGGAHVLGHGLPSIDLMQSEFEDALFYSGAITATDLLEKRVPRLELKAEHRMLLDTGVDLPTFKVKTYKESLGLTILSDRSHPGWLEGIEEPPPWLPVFLESIREQNEMIKLEVMTNRDLNENLKTHISVLKAINESFQKWLAELEKLGRGGIEASKEVPDYAG